MSKVVEVAFSQLGTLERGKNLTPFGAWYGEHAGEKWDGQAWCAMFVSWCFWRAGFALPELQAPGFSGFASVQIGLEACKKRGWVVTDPAPGDIVFVTMHHVGLVLVASRESDVIITIEGNTPGPTGKEGVFLKVRRFGGVVAFARPVFDPSATCHGPCWVCNECPA